MRTWRGQLETVETVAGIFRNFRRHDTTSPKSRPGLGIGYLPDFIARAAVSAGDLISVLPQALTETGHLYVLWPHTAQPPHRLRVFLDALRVSKRFGVLGYGAGNAACSQARLIRLNSRQRPAGCAGWIDTFAGMA